MGIKSIGYTVNEKLSQEAKNMLEKLNNQEKLINYQKLYLKGGSNVEYDFSDYRSLKEFFKQFITEKLKQKRLKQYKKSLMLHLVHWRYINQKKKNMLVVEKVF